MKKHLLVCCFLVAVTSLGAQSYSAFVPGRDAFYVYNTGAGSWKVNAIRTDSIGLNGSFTEYHDYRREVPSAVWASYCLNFADTSWLGHSILNNTVSGSTAFLNEQNDSIVFTHAAGIGQTGMLYVFPNGDRIVGTVTAIAPMTFMSITDTVKTMTLQALDAVSTPIANDFNGKTVMVSKTRGLVRAYRWKKFPNDTVSYSLTGMTNPQEGMIEQAAASIFNYAVGDRFDFETHYNSNAMSQPTTHNYYTHYVAAKTVSVNGDTITYDYLEDHTQKIGATIISSSTGQPTSETIILSAMDGQYDMNLFPLEFADGPDTISGYQGITPDWPYAPAMYNGRVQKSYKYEWYWFYSQDSACYSPANLSWGPCDGMNMEWAEGVGQVYGRGGSVTCFSNYNLVYFDKGTDVWGAPHNWSVINAIPAHGAGSIPTQVWPNPATNELNVNLTGFSGTEVTYQIYTITGQLLSEGAGIPIGGTLQMPVNQISEGIYTIVVSSESNVWTGRFVK